MIDLEIAKEQADAICHNVKISERDSHLLQLIIDWNKRGMVEIKALIQYISTL